MREGKEFCVSFKKLENGETTCDKWDTLYEGEKCLKWEDREVTSQVTTTVLNEITNPGYQEALKKAQEAEALYLIKKGEVDGLRLEKMVEIKKLEAKYQKEWIEIEEKWIIEHRKVLESEILKFTTEQ